MDISWNSRGLVFTVNSLFPRRYMRGGVGTAFVARHLLEATSLADAKARASFLNVSSAMSYQLGWRSATKKRIEGKDSGDTRFAGDDGQAGTLEQLEVDTGGGPAHSAVHLVGRGDSYFHANEFTVLPDAQQYPDNSTASRTQRWREMQPVDDGARLRGFLGDTTGAYPVWRNDTEPDDCFSEVAAVFDLNRATLSVWTGNPKLGPPQRVFELPGL
eukprot:g4975.t1